MTNTLPVSQRHRDAAMGMLNHAFRNAPDDCTRDVDLHDIAEAFARFERELTQSTADRVAVLEAAIREAGMALTDDQASIYQRKRKAERILVAVLKGSSDAAE